MNNGPYESVIETLSEALPWEIRALHDSGRVRPSDPDRLVRGTQLAHLEDACASAGVELGAYDRSILEWLAGYEPSTVQVVIGLIRRAADNR